jgi:hypothetical protein
MEYCGSVGLEHHGMICLAGIRRIRIATGIFKIGFNPDCGIKYYTMADRQ